MGTLTVLFTVLVLLLVGVAYMADHWHARSRPRSAPRHLHQCGTEKKTLARGGGATLSPLGTKATLSWPPCRWETRMPLCQRSPSSPYTRRERKKKKEADGPNLRRRGEGGTYAYRAK